MSTQKLQAQEAVLTQIQQQTPQINEEFLNFLQRNYTSDQLIGISQTLTYQADKQTIKWRDGKDFVTVKFDDNGQLVAVKARNVDQDESIKVRNTFEFTTDGADYDYSTSSKIKQDGSIQRTSTHQQMHNDFRRYQQRVSLIDSQLGMRVTKTSTIDYQATGEQWTFEQQNRQTNKYIGLYMNGQNMPEIGLHYDQTRNMTTLTSEGITTEQNQFRSADLGALWGVGYKKATSTRVTQADGTVLSDQSHGFSASVDIISGVQGSYARSITQDGVTRQFGAAFDVNPVVGRVKGETAMQTITQNADGSVAVHGNEHKGVLGIGGFTGLNLGGLYDKQNFDLQYDAQGNLISGQNNHQRYATKTNEVGRQNTTTTLDNLTVQTEGLTHVIGGSAIYRNSDGTAPQSINHNSEDAAKTVALVTPDTDNAAYGMVSNLNIAQVEGAPQITSVNPMDNMAVLPSKQNTINTMQTDRQNAMVLADAQVALINGSATNQQGEQVQTADTSQNSQGQNTPFRFQRVQNTY